MIASLPLSVKVNTPFVLCPKRKVFTICMHDSMAFTFLDHPSNLRFKETTIITTFLMTPLVLLSEAWALTEEQQEKHQSLSLTQVVLELEPYQSPWMVPVKSIR